MQVDVKHTAQALRTLHVLVNIGRILHVVGGILLVNSQNRNITRSRGSETQIKHKADFVLHNTVLADHFSSNIHHMVTDILQVALDRGVSIVILAFGRRVPVQGGDNSGLVRHIEQIEVTSLNNTMLHASLLGGHAVHLTLQHRNNSGGPVGARAKSVVGMAVGHIHSTQVAGVRNIAFIEEVNGDNLAIGGGDGVQVGRDLNTTRTRRSQL
mmetsp:Transcript_421/g.1012  ORF Transcript_421/g.1012 Transcript_421/m.1012 type:complete len:212 (-) Transcript_421:5444-6079(-)